MLKNDTNSIIALADFLNHHEPPASNFMSRAESDARGTHSIEKSAFKIFGRQNSRRATRGPKLLQLPDSAVAARTVGGSRHIAISIPLEYDHPYYTPAQPVAPPRPHSQYKLSSERPERVAIRVLKPVIEVQESGLPFLTRNNEETQLDDNTQSSNTERKMVAKPDSVRTQKIYVTVSPVGIVRHDSTRSYLSHSGGTAGSTASVGTSLAHSRGPSSTYSTPSSTMISSSKLEFPARTSSVTQVLRGLHSERAQAYVNNEPILVEDLPRSPLLAEKPALAATISGTSTSHSQTTAVLGTAETAQGSNAASSLHTIGRVDTSKPSNPMSPAPTRQLPRVPESPSVTSLLPSPSLSVSRKTTGAFGVIDDIISKGKLSPPVINNTEESTKITPQSRQQRVKARKQRDVASHREKFVHSATVTETSSSTDPQIPPASPARREKHMQETAHPPLLSSVTDIMLVADLPPFTGIVRLEDFSYPERAVKRRMSESNSLGNMSAQLTKGAHTPPPSRGSDSDSIAGDRSFVRPRDGGKSPNLEARRQERRAKRNMSLREKGLDARLRKIEKENEMLLNTLSGIVSSFGELNRMLPKETMRSKIGGEEAGE